ncbi:MAG TPA: hypothetical protein VJ865_07660 [Gemmatimonadaceae bacterium]|nr:hypothetical protein [Gemmatimonadaceae bacterium]
MDPFGRVIVAVVFLVTVATVIRSVAAMFFSWRRSTGPADSAGPSFSDARLSRLEHAVDAIALEVERISEGQRFTTKLLSEQAKQSHRLSRELTNTPT